MLRIAEDDCGMLVILFQTVLQIFTLLYSGRRRAFHQDQIAAIQAFLKDFGILHRQQLHDFRTILGYGCG